MESVRKKREPVFDVVGKRTDSVGMFWNEPKQIKLPPLEKVKRTPPEPIWLEPGYYPNLKEAQGFDFNLFTDTELVGACNKREQLVFDIESYGNYFLVIFKSLQTGKSVIFESIGLMELDLVKLKWVVENFQLIGFNSNAYDLPLLSIALTGATPEQLWDATNRIIAGNERYYFVMRSFKAKQLECDHVDVMHPSPGQASLKIYGGRLNCSRMQDLPFAPGSVLDDKQIDIVRWYCSNDLAETELLYKHLESAVMLRKKLGETYNLELRSKSDAQIAEAVLTQEIQKLSNFKLSKPVVIPGLEFFYQVPTFIKFKTPHMNQVLEVIRSTPFVIKENGGITAPKQIKDLKVRLGSTNYKMGIGGLHSMEKCQHVSTTTTHKLCDKDVTSYYPAIILNCNLFPKQLGANFLTVYETLVTRRLAAKRSGDTLTADTLKITINGSFGKLGSKYSMLYSPNLLVQVTLTGQLSLLMLIEALELAGISVVSANTDGVVLCYPNELQGVVNATCAAWEGATNFNLEENTYSSLSSRDVNNYIALTTCGEIKSKGVFSSKRLDKNPSNMICREAVKELIKNKTPVEETIQACKDITKFVTVRTVKGGAVKDGRFLGKAIRFYYASNTEGEIVYAKSGNKVPRSECAKPLMKLPNDFPQDVDFDWYVREANSMLASIGYT